MILKFRLLILSFFTLFTGLVMGQPQSQTAESFELKGRADSRFENLLFDDSTGTFIEKQSKLIWMRCSAGRVFNRNNSTCEGVGLGNGHEFSFLRAVEYANAARDHGVSQWRLPTLEEYERLLNIAGTWNLCTRAKQVLAVLFPSNRGSTISARQHWLATANSIAARTADLEVVMNFNTCTLTNTKQIFEEKPFLLVRSEVQPAEWLNALARVPNAAREAEASRYQANQSWGALNWLVGPSSSQTDDRARRGAGAETFTCTIRCQGSLFESGITFTTNAQGNSWEDARDSVQDDAKARCRASKAGHFPAKIDCSK